VKFFKHKKMQYTYKVILWPFSITIVGVENKKKILDILSVCVCTLRYLANCHVCPVQLHHILLHYLIHVTIFRK
jgi:hypothetical protein